MITLDPGIYEIGKEDGSIDPFFVRVGRGNTLESGTMETYDLFVKAITNEEGPWWFRFIYVPSECPIEVDEDGRARFIEP